MNKHFRLAAIVCGCFALSWPLCLVGCQSQQPDTTPGPKTENGDTSWGGQPPQAGKSLPGIDFARIHWALLNDDLVFAVWIDRKPISHALPSILGTKQKPGLWDVTYGFSFSDPPAVKLQGRTTDGKGGSLTLNEGAPLDLTQGRLLLAPNGFWRSDG